MKSRISALFLFCAGVAFGQNEDLSKVQIEIEKIAPGLAVLKGSGGNIGLSYGDDGACVIDDQFAPLNDKIRAAIKILTPKEPRFVINNHWHFDHVGGNEALGKSGSVIVAHENVRKRMSTDQVIEAFQKKIPASPKEALPVITFNSEIKFFLNGQEISVLHKEHAHTDGDAVIHFKSANVFHMGDLYFNGLYPFIDISSGGSV